MTTCAGVTNVGSITASGAGWAAKGAVAYGGAAGTAKVGAEAGVYASAAVGTAGAKWFSVQQPFTIISLHSHTNSLRGCLWH
ncbi:hypothetical protein ACIS_00686 [Anaplasma centrale str. Israel]|uniref:Uncharacterized protein n=1 Tax=Anaplasma centrale (strain Israel) TaxID=574556 RepID=D1AUN0_ANACI|nr:hypothetical protein ACIS_00686 [Anaplasma centrale str. Israel]